MKRTKKKKKMGYRFKKGFMIAAFILVSFLMTEYYSLKFSNSEADAQTCVDPGSLVGGGPCRKVFPAGQATTSPNCLSTEYMGGSGYNTGSSMDSNDIWIWCCQF